MSVGRILRRMWLFSLDSAKSCSVEVVPVLPTSIVWASATLHHWAWVLSHFFLSAYPIWKEGFLSICFIIYILIWRWFGKCELWISFFCEMSDHILCPISVLFFFSPRLHYVTLSPWYELLMYFFFLCLLLFWLDSDFFSKWWLFAFLVSSFWIIRRNAILTLSICFYGFIFYI